MSIQQQHVEISRKLSLRRRLLERSTRGVAFVPFIGDGDIAAELYADRKIYGADIDGERVAVARNRLPQAEIVQADCNQFPFAETEPIAVADFDAYSNPYLAIQSFWKHADKCDTLVMFGTDGLRMPCKRRKEVATIPAGTMTQGNWREAYNFWWTRHVLPWLTELVSPMAITAKSKYLRGNGMLYWGIAVER